MGTRADFYVGRGVDAEWLGSIAWDGYPEGIEAAVLKAKTVTQFKRELLKFFKERDDVTLPELGWPWPWTDSHTTDYGYCFDKGRVWYWGEVEGKGDCWIAAAGRALDRKTPGVYPDMAEKSNVTFGKRSGIIVIGG